MVSKYTYKELEQRLFLLENELDQRKRFEEINNSLFKISHAVNMTSSLDELFKTIHIALSPIIDTTNFFIALYDRVLDNLSFPYIVDTVDEYYPPVIEISKTESSTAEVVRTGAPLLVTKADILLRRSKSRLVVPSCTPAEIWLGVPLKTRDEIVGVMAVQNYQNPLCYDQTDMDVMVAVADQVAIAIERKLAEEALWASEKRFHKLLQEIPSVAVQGYRLDGTTQFWNEASEHLYGYSAQEAIGRNLVDLIIPPAMRSEVKQAIRHMAKTGKPIPSSELSLMRKDGSLVKVFSSHAIIEVPGRRQELFCIDIDLTERKRAEEALQTGVAHLESIFRAAPVGIGVVTDRVIYQANEKLCQISGYAHNELIGQSARMMYTDEASYNYVGSEKYRLIQRSGTGTVETKWRRKDGIIIDILLSSTPFDTADLSKGVTFTAMDITKLKQTEQILKENEFYLFKAQEIGKLGHFSYDPITQTIVGSSELLRILDMDSDAKIFDAFAQTIHSDDGDLILPLIDRALQEGTPYDVKHRVCHKNGNVLYVHAKGETISTPQGTRMVGTVQDITETKRVESEREKLQAQLTQAQKMESIGALAGGVAHDYNNMLSVIIGYTEIALDQVAPGEKLHPELEKILDAATRSMNITRQLLAFARKQTIAPKVLNLNETIANMLTMLQRLIGENINLTWLPSPTLRTVKLDPSQIDQILANLCINARDAINGIGTITIGTENVIFDETYVSGHTELVSGEYILLTVSDDGCGMDDTVCKNIFEPFFTTKGEGQGTGLGLATVYGIAKQNNGFIYVYSEPNRGTTFKLYLPSHKGKTYESSPQATQKIPLGQDETILVVEDELIIMNMVATMLELLGYHVLSANTPKEALRLVADHANDIRLVITDVIMPEMDGGQLAKKLNDIRQGIKTLFMSGYTADVIAHQGILDDDTNFIQKPFAKNVLAAKVRAVLDKD